MKANAQMEQQSEAIVKFDNVVKRFGNFTAVEKADFEIGRGEFLAIMGSSGCGKTTTLRMLAGLEDPTEGAIYLDGEKVNGKATWDRDTPMVWQSLALFPFLTVQENVEFALKMRGVGKEERRQRAEKWLEKMQITEFANRNINQLSGGQKARVGIARAVALDPKFLILDEPTAALDVSIQAVVLNLLVDLRAKLGLSYLFVSHDLHVVRLLCDHVIVMKDGQIVEQGQAHQVMSHPQSPYTKSLIAAAPKSPERAATIDQLETPDAHHSALHDKRAS